MTEVSMSPNGKRGEYSKTGTDVEDAEEIEGTIEEALKATGIGRFNVWITITAGLVLYTSNNEIWTIGYVLPSAECDLKLNLQQMSILVTAGTVGITTTQYFWGYLSDKVGRRNVMLYTLAAGCVCSIISALVPIFWMLVLCRFLNGAFIACSSGVIIAYIGEFFSIRYRAVGIAVMSIFVGLSMTLLPVLAWIIIPTKFTSTLFGSNLASWRVYLLTTGLPAIPAWIFLYFSPESPTFLAQAQRNEEALQLLHKMRRINKAKEGKVIQKLTVEGTSNKDVRIWELFSSKYIWKTILVCTLQAGVLGPSGGLFLWYPDILQKITRSKEDMTVCDALYLSLNTTTVDYTSIQNGTLSNSGVEECQLTLDSSVYLQNMLIGLAFTVGYISISALLRFVGVKNMLIVFMGLAGGAALCLHFITTSEIIKLLFMALLVLPGLCVMGVNAAVVEMFPTNMRGMALCLTMLSGRMGAILSSSLIGYLLRWNCKTTFMLFTFILIGCSLLSVLLPISVKSTSAALKRNTIEIEMK